MDVQGNLYKQYLNGKYCDLEIQVENSSFRAHSCVIAAASWVLEAILQSSKPEDIPTGIQANVTKLSIQLHGVTSYAISALLNFIYTGKFNPEVYMDIDKHREIQNAAKLYKLDEISQHLASSSVATSNSDGVDNAIGNFQIPPMLESEHLNDSIFDKIIGEEAGKSEDRPQKSQVNIILTKLPTDEYDLTTQKLPMKEAQEHVSQCFKFSKENGLLYCILCCEICSSPEELLDHMTEHKNEARRRAGNSRPERAAAAAANAAASLALTDSIDIIDDLGDDEISSPRKRKKAMPKKSFLCSECGLSYTTRVYLLRHYALRHPSSHFCKFCGERFQTLEILEEHLLIHANEVDPDKLNVKLDFQRLKTTKGRRVKKIFTCNLCSSSFLKKRDLMQHQQLQHGIVKPMHVCTSCGKEFKEKASLRSHTRVHTGEKPFMCSYCGNSFADQKTWKDHERRHRGEKPFLCTTCGKSFTYRQSFTRHMKFHEGKRPFQCSFCGKAFVLRQNLKEHEKRHTK